MVDWLVPRRWAIFWFVLSVPAFVIGWSAHRENERLEGAQETSAVVTKVNDRGRSGPQKAYLDVKLPGGKVVQATSSRFRRLPYEGTTVRVEYAIDPDGVVVREAGIGPNRGAVVWPAIGGFLVLCGIVVLIRAARGDQQADAVEDAGQSEG